MYSNGTKPGTLQFGIDREYRKKYELVWHHHEDENRMQLIPKKLHQYVRHTGGYALWSKPLESLRTIMKNYANLFEYTARPADSQRILEIESKLGKSYLMITRCCFQKLEAASST
ncbi:HNH endonuclease [Corynebacterium macginleyi]|nr:HNH endonuclease [Corynebacterium macginleyi]RMB67136.1 HNH endonuclease [Corynebacterium macginleyi]